MTAPNRPTGFRSPSPAAASSASAPTPAPVVPVAPEAAGESAAAPAAPQRGRSFDPQASAALFRVFRGLELNAVLAKLKATRQAENRWVLGSGDVIEVSGQPGWQTWKNLTTQESQKGAIDLVTHVLRLKGSGQALSWLRGQFPEAEGGVEAEKNRIAAAARVADHDPSAPPPVDGGVRRAPAAAPAKGNRWTKEQLDELFEKYKGVRLSEVMHRLGAEPNQDGDSNKWKMPGIGNIITKGQLWKNVQTEVDKGYGGISFAKHALGLSNQVEGLKWMIKEFGEELGDDLIADDVEAGPKDFSPPERFPELANAVSDYLVNERGLPSELVKEVIRNGSVYGSHPWNEARQRYLTNITRCVFLGQASAELRDTDPDGFKGCCDGSQTDSSGFSVRPSEKVPEFLVGLTEAAIDGLSYRALFPGRFAMSTNGAGRFLLQFRIAKEAVDREFGVRLALDADGAGDLAAQKLFNAFYVRKALSHHLSVPEEKVDEWLLEGGLVLEVDKSPHQLFFNTGWAPELKVHEGKIVDTEKGVEKQWFPTDQLAKPTIRMAIRKDLHPKLLRGELSLTVSQAGYNYVTETLNIKRDRPQHAKDWNEVLKRLGATYAQAYDEASRHGFAKGAPPLPPELEALRVVPEAPAPEPSPPARPSAPSTVPGPRGGETAPAPAPVRGRPAGMRR